MVEWSQAHSAVIASEGQERATGKPQTCEMGGQDQTPSWQPPGLWPRPNKCEENRWRKQNDNVVGLVVSLWTFDGCSQRWDHWGCKNSCACASKRWIKLQSPSRISTPTSVGQKRQVMWTLPLKMTNWSRDAASLTLWKHSQQHPEFFQFMMHHFTNLGHKVHWQGTNRKSICPISHSRQVFLMLGADGHKEATARKGWHETENSASC